MLPQLQKNIKEKILELRAIDRLINSTDFISIYRDEPDINNAISNYNKHGIECWIKKQSSKDIELLSMRELRDMARKYRIPFYYNLSRLLLLSELKSYVRIENEDAPLSIAIENSTTTD